MSKKDYICFAEVSKDGKDDDVIFLTNSDRKESSLLLHTSYQVVRRRTVGDECEA